MAEALSRTVSDADRRVTQGFAKDTPSIGYRRMPVARNQCGHRTGKRSFTVKGTNLVSVHVSTQPGFTTGEPVALPIKEQLVLQNPTFQRNYDISPDGKYFIAVIRAP